VNLVENLAHIQKRLSEEGDKTVAFFESLSQSDWDQQVYTRIWWRVRQVCALGLLNVLPKRFWMFWRQRDTSKPGH
jgi:hypothetical protein